MIKGRSIRINSAENAIKKSIEHFLLLTFNYPSEAVNCIEQLNKALELLLKEIYIQNGKNRRGMNSSDRINEYWDWESAEKEIVNELRKTRNKLQHEGELEWEGRESMRHGLISAYWIAGQTYQSLDYDLDEIFTRGEKDILQGLEINWKDEALSLANLSYHFYKDDPELAIQISNGALEKAVRGLAECWRIDNAGLLPLSEVIQAMYDNKYEFSSDLPIDYEDYQTKPYFFSRDDHEYCDLSCDPLTNIGEVLSNVRAYRQDDAIKKVLDDSWAVVASFIKTAPYLDYFESLVSNWDLIIDEFLKQSPNVTFPLLNDEHGITPWWDEDQGIGIHFKQSLGDVNWDENHEALFIEIIEKVCGKKPDNLQFWIHWDDSSSWDL
jgi:hypothetical protein